MSTTKDEKTLKVEVRAATLQTRTGIIAKKGDIISIPADEKNQTGSIRHGLRSGNLRVITAETDLKPVTSIPAAATPAQKAGEVRRLEEDSREKKGGATKSTPHKQQGDKKTSDEE